VGRASGERFTFWVASTHTLHLFLDSLDECLLRIETLGPALAPTVRMVIAMESWRTTTRWRCPQCLQRVGHGGLAVGVRGVTRELAQEAFDLLGLSRHSLNYPPVFRQLLIRNTTFPSVSAGIRWDDIGSIASSTTSPWSL